MIQNLPLDQKHRPSGSRLTYCHNVFPTFSQVPKEHKIFDFLIYHVEIHSRNSQKLVFNKCNTYS